MIRILKQFSVPPGETTSPQLLRMLVNQLRPRDLFSESYKQRFSKLVNDLEASPEHCRYLSKHLGYLFQHMELTSLLTESGIPESTGFFAELWRKIKHKIIPPLENKQSLGYAVRNIFHRKWDYRWIERIPTEEWERLFALLQHELDPDNASLHRQMIIALELLSYRVAGASLENTLYNSKQPAGEHPFIRQSQEASRYILLLDQGDLEQASEMALNLLRTLRECHVWLDQVREDQKHNGTGLGQTYLLARISRQLNRMQVIIALLERRVSVEIPRAVMMFRNIVLHENQRNSLRVLFSESLGMLAYQISEHKSRTGEHYITTTRKEYRHFFRSAMGGGYFAAFMATLKIVIHHLNLALFNQHLLFSLNYAAGFIGIHVSGSTLATKQPSMTANALAGSLGAHEHEHQHLKEMSLTLAKVWRSQFIAFAGNLLITFPAAYVMAAIYWYATGNYLAEGDEAIELIRQQNPAEHPIYWYAAITGCMLFISGIISGYFDNMVLFNKIPQRIKEHPVLIKVLPARALDRFSHYLEHNLGSLAGNFTLGFLLGFAGFFGTITGLPLDIRHITISTGHYAIGVFGLHNHLSAYDWTMTTVGVVLIGFVNFLVSFTLAYLVALKSRQVHFYQYPAIVRYTLKYALRFPLDFWYPPKQDRSVERVFGKDKKQRESARQATEDKPGEVSQAGEH